MTIRKSVTMVTQVTVNFWAHVTGCAAAKNGAVEVGGGGGDYIYGGSE